MTDTLNNKKMKYGLLMPNGGPSLNTPQKITKYAKIAEQSGWDAFFIWDSIGPSATDPWVTLASIAMNTEKIKIGAMVTPVARRRPWKLAKEAVSIDQLSEGRLIFGAGLGDDPVFAPFNEDTNKKVRATKLDEGLNILNQLWSGEKVNFNGDYFKITDITYNKPVQTPRIPIWIGGLWPNKGPFRRAAKWDGMIPH
ncbi:MAG: LLM class flavin-dependent oxidoreductase, partial [Candidatus Heimdallarchaeota archaeon]|nr:LLM class flavin-dependent oxidoreductase [Candidatus Heimdallarchaeota archaeon]